MPGTRKLGRTTDHRKAMLRAMVTFLLEKGRIETTVTRAKEVRALTEKMITLGKQNTLQDVYKRQGLHIALATAVSVQRNAVIQTEFVDDGCGLFSSKVVDDLGLTDLIRFKPICGIFDMRNIKHCTHLK